MRKYIYILTSFLLSMHAQASVSPISGKFSNFTKTALDSTFSVVSKGDTLKTKINLVVTKNKHGQQFFLQCAKGNELGFGVITELKSPKSKAKIKAGQYCPFKEVQVEFDYDWVIIRANGKTGTLFQGEINVPVLE